MRLLISAGVLLLGVCLPASAQNACPSAQLATAARSVASIRHRLHGMGVAPGSPEVPKPIGIALTDLQGALAQSAEAALQCAGVSASAETMQQTLATALHANQDPGSDAAPESTGKRSVGTYGPDLAVQVFQLFSTPRLFEVDFRYGLECGDDNLLLVFRAGSETATDGWHEDLRVAAPRYATVGDALGDFVLLSPVTSSATHPSWRYLVAHGHPGCGETPRPSEFTLELLTPTADPTRPEHTWTFQHPYTTGSAMPRLATTEDTIDFRLVPAAVVTGSARDGANPGPAGTASPPAQAEVYRFHLTAQGTIEPSRAEASEGSGPGPGAKP